MMQGMKQEIGLALIAMGFLILLAGMAQDFGQGRASYGEVTLVGPIPIVVGSSPQIGGHSNGWEPGYW